MRTLLLILVTVIGLDAAARPARWVAREFQTPREASQKIGAMARELEAEKDPRALFAHVYSLTIQATAKNLERFANPAWVSRLVLNYANIYRKTVYNELRGRHTSMPLAWQFEFEYARGGRGEWKPDFDVIYGINVHIARDLVEALYVTPTDFANPSLHRDFLKISDVLTGTMPAIWSVYARFTRSLGLFPGLQQSVMTGWIRRLRAKAWNDALVKTRLSALDQKCIREARRYGLWLPFM
ncbi:MAG TPA: DUF5995 family protein [Bdellovibrionales bacterium]|nr:DUF5995 family protein [Bdellovibrionales bacterium]